MNRPKISIPLDTFDKIMELLGAVCLVLLVAYPLYHYSTLPEIIPKHFDASGQPDSYGSKNTIWSMPILGLSMYIGLIVLNRYPHIFNFPIEITEENASYQYRIITKMIRALNLCMAIIIFIITYQTIQSAKLGSGGLGSWFLPFVLVSSLSPIAWYLIKVSKK